MAAAHEVPGTDLFRFKSRRDLMLKNILLATAVAFAFTSPAFADDMAKVECTPEAMKMVHDAMDKDKDPKMAKDVKMAGDEMKMADDAMKANKMDECKKHVGMAMDHMMLKHN
jgi:hypothetical protein